MLNWYVQWLLLTTAHSQDIDPEDHATLDALGPQHAVDEVEGGGRTLADIIFSKMEGGAVSKGQDEDGV